MDADPDQIVSLETPGTAVQILPIPLGSYVDEDSYPRLEADAEADALASLVASALGGTVVRWPAEHGRDLGAVDSRLQKWADPRGRLGSFIIWVGHGLSNRIDAQLVVPGRPGMVADSVFLPETLAVHLATEQRRRLNEAQWAVILVEACGAGRFVELVAAELDRKYSPRNVILIGSGHPIGGTHLGLARAAIEKAVARYTVNDTVIDLRDLACQIEDELDAGIVRYLSANRCHVTRSAATITAPLDVYRELVLLLDQLPVAERAHFARKGMGSDFGELAWNFVGRHQELADIAAWLAGTRAGMLVVTGRAGSGKSAVLGNLLLRSRPAIWTILRRAGVLADYPSGTPMEDNFRAPRFDVALHLTGLTADDVLASIAAAAEVPELSTGPTSSFGTGRAERTRRLVTHLRSSRSSLTVLADALDEAQEPFSIATLLRVIATAPGVRVIVGTRASTREGPDSADTSDTDLLDALGQRAEVITVRRDSALLERYVREQLRRSQGSRDDAVNRVVSMIALPGMESKQGRQFLFARLAVHELLADPELLDSERVEDLRRMLEGDHTGLFAVAMERFLRQSPTTASAIRALAHAHGRGLPRTDQIWAAVASAVGHHHVSEDDLDTALTAAAPYVMVDAEASQSVYRLAHRTFQEYLANEESFNDARATVFERLLDSAERALDTEGRAFNAYLVDHLAEHASDSAPDSWTSLAVRPRVLDGLNTERVAEQALRTGSGIHLPTAIRATILAAHDLNQAPICNRTGLRHLAMAALGTSNPDHQPWPTLSSWGVAAASLEPLAIGRTLTGHSGAVTSLAGFRGNDGRALVASASRDRTVQVWDTETGELVGKPLTGHNGWVLCVVAFRGPDGQPLLATGGDDATVRVWDPQVGKPIRPPFTGHNDWVVSIASFTTTAGRTLLATASGDATVRVWDPYTGAEVIKPISKQIDWVRSVAAFSGPDGVTLLATGGRRGSVQIWDADSGKAIGRPLKGHKGPVYSCTWIVGTDGRPWVASAGMDGSVRVWNPLLGTSVGGPLTGHAGSVLSVTGFPQARAGSLLASAGMDGSVRVWDPALGASVGTPLAGHIGPAMAVTAIRGQDSQALLVSAGDDWTVRIWDPATASTAVPWTGHRGRVNSLLGVDVSEGRPLLATGGEDGTVRIWDSLAATLIGQPLTGHRGGVNSMAVLASPGGKPLLASAGEDGTVRIWDPLTVSPVGDPLTGHRGRVNSIAALPEATGGSLLASAGEDGTVRIWDVVASACVRRLRSSGADLRSMAVLEHASGSLLAVAARDGALRVWDTQTGALLWQPRKSLTGTVRSVTAFHGSDGRTSLVTVGRDGEIRRWDLDSLKMVWRTRWHTDWTDCSSTAVGRISLALAADDGSIAAWDRKGDVFARLDVGRPVTGLAVFGDDLLVALGSGWARLLLR